MVYQGFAAVAVKFVGRQIGGVTGVRVVNRLRLKRVWSRMSKVHH